MSSRRRSLRTRLLVWLIVPMTVFGLIAAWVTHVNARRTAGLLQDAALLAAARVMAADVRWSGHDLVASISPSTIQIVGTEEGDQVFYRVEIAGGAVIAGTSDFPRTTLTGSPQWYDAKVGDLPVRAVSLERPMVDSGRTVGLIVSLGRTLTSRDALIASLWKPQLVYILGSIVAAILLVCAGLALELRPLGKLARGLMADPLRSRARIDSTDLHTELQPMVSAFNASLDVIERQTATQRRFIAAAAHQMRTPLTLLGSQLQYARRQNSLDEVRETLAAMHHSNRAMVTLINQLLILAQAEAADYTAFAGEAVNLRTVVTRALEELALMSRRRDIELAVSFDGKLVVTGSEPLLSAVISNLIDNAIRYSPGGTRVTIEAQQKEAVVRIVVVDEGPGIPAALRDRVFEPFFRASEEEGSGLGLAIAREIVRAHGGTISLSDVSAGRGTNVIVTLPGITAE
ncbi:sensor histidine kinase [Caballeronia sp. LZ062]|uniref:sensor histidine kinase n=1 Tax=unclassified Caballeronia TaxID=2646786 RepID=UPI0028636557|nr:MULTISPECIES: sensor histidine kinase [unclassified Caballeronia]MDR5857736.1 sensor histidine kinase [Caballeronia sp. LZ050]MDR5869286.1 sensor histidine kinase [Caballeronia sp. LZ062]